jgi:hypothetical protein
MKTRNKMKENQEVWIEREIIKHNRRVCREIKIIITIGWLINEKTKEIRIEAVTMSFISEGGLRKNLGFGSCR